MATKMFTPRQVARALGVSESSVKRWVDSGRLPAAKTAGGHRKVPLPSVAEFVRSTGHHIAHPDMLGMVATAQKATLRSAQDELFDLLVEGNEAACRGLVLGFYQRGESIAAMADELIGPVFRRIGDGWEAGDVQVFQERQSCEVMMTTLHEIRRWIADPPPEAPLALVATPHGDFAEAPARLVELSLVAEGWRVVQAGSGLPLSEIVQAADKHGPRLVCLSVTHVADRDEFLAELNQEFTPRLRAMETPPVIALGGNALRGLEPEAATCDLLAFSLSELVRFAGDSAPAC